jgi:2-polyprenyl-6-methoxyphenol hydroxylase-like FAD-dependent oxidoreductase
MRTAPPNVLQALRGYDSRLGLVWNDERHRWFLTYDGALQLFALHHEDGSPVFELNVGELLQILRRTDQAQRGRLYWLREADQARARLAAAQERRRREQQAALRREVAERARVLEYGPRAHFTLHQPAQQVAS